MKTDAAEEQERRAWRLAEAGYAPKELAFALGVHLDQARIYLRRYRAKTIRTTRSRGLPISQTAPSKWTDPFSLTQLWQFATQNHSGDSENETTHP